MKMKIRNKIVLLYMVTLIVLSLILIVLVSDVSKKTTSDAIYETAEITLHMADDRLVEKIDSYFLVMKELASTDAFSGETVDAELAKRLMEECRVRNGYERIGYTDANGINQNKLNLSQSEYFVRCKETKQPVVSELYESETAEGQMSVLFAVPILHGEEFAGMVYCAADSKLLTDIIAEVRIGENSTAFILDKAGTVIASEEYNMVTTKCNFINDNNTSTYFQTVEMKPVSEAMVAGESGVKTYTHSGHEYFYLYEPMEIANGWSLCVYGDVETFMQGHYEGVNSVVVFTIILLVIFVVVMGITVNKISAPITKSTQRMMQLAEGDLHSIVPAIKTRDETKVLADSIESTIGSLNIMIGEISSVLEGMSKGDFTTEVSAELQGDLAPVKSSLNQILEDLRGLVREISTTTSQVLFGARNVAQMSEALASTVTEQNSIMDNIRQNIEKVTSDAEKNAENAETASKMAELATEAVVQGNEYMNELAAAMTKMEESSQAIEKINKTISDIAFQTNILALNAAVEAARAGAAGKGFAVVAEEVKVLAEKSAVASEDASNLIEQTVMSIRDSMSVANKTSASMDMVVERASVVGENIVKIANMSQIQLEELEEVTRSIGEIAEALTTTAASSEEGSATAQELNVQAKTLSGMMERFKV